MFHFTRCENDARLFNLSYIIHHNDISWKQKKNKKNTQPNVTKTVWTISSFFMITIPLRIKQTMIQEQYIPNLTVSSLRRTRIKEIN